MDSTVVGSIVDLSRSETRTVRMLLSPQDAAILDLLISKLNIAFPTRDVGDVMTVGEMLQVLRMIKTLSEQPA